MKANYKNCVPKGMIWALAADTGAVPDCGRFRHPGAWHLPHCAWNFIRSRIYRLP